MKKVLAVLISMAVLLSQNMMSQTPCVNGLADGFECENVDLLAHITPADIGGATTNEVWGWTDPLDSTEYVLLGASTGMFFFRIDDPIHPLLLGTLPTHTTNSSWRTFRTYNNYAFIASEANGHGMQVFDLTRLRNVATIPTTFTEDAFYGGFSKCHTLAINEETGYAYACGTNTYLGGIHIINIQDPLNPTIAGGFENNGYTHEAQILVYDGPDEDYQGHSVAFCFNGAVPLPLTIVDVTDPSDASAISLTSYPGQKYCHQGWLTEDRNYLLIDDELDEYYNFADSLHTHIFDVHDLDAPVYMGYYVGGTAIDHNQYIVGNLAYQSNYTDGLSILDVTHIADTILHRVAYFDHYSAGDPELFQGEWMNYPFFKSGVVPVTDIYNGMFLLKPNFIEITYESTACASDTFHFDVWIKEGFTGPFELTVFGLPEGVQWDYAVDNSTSSTVIHVDLTQLEILSGTLSFDVNVQGAYNLYTRTATVNFVQPIPLYPDADGDGFGLASDAVMLCPPQDGFAALSGDCNDEDNTIYPQADGTFDGIDNDCNGVIELDEVPFCADLNGDFLVNVQDVYIMTGDIGCTGENCIADINSDGTTNLSDLLILLADFGEFCE